MTEHEELALYKKALVDWEKPIEGCAFKTRVGFCYYFKRSALKFTKENFRILWDQRLLVTSRFHYNGMGIDKLGRQQRVTALKNAIEILENKLKQEL